MLPPSVMRQPDTNSQLQSKAAVTVRGQALEILSYVCKDLMPHLQQHTPVEAGSNCLSCHLPFLAGLRIEIMW